MLVIDTHPQISEGVVIKSEHRLLEQQEKMAEVVFCLSIFMYSEQGAIATAGSVGFIHKRVVHAAEGTAVSSAAWVFGALGEEVI